MSTPTLTKHTVAGALGRILVDIRTSDRTSSRPLALVLHGFKGFKDWGMFPPLAERLARAGLTAVTQNLSGSGVDDAGDFTLPERFGHNTFSAELQDTQSIVDALMRGELGLPPPSSLGIVGHSRGGGIGILQAARDSRIGALVTWSAISTVQRWPASERAAWRSTGQTEIRNARTGQVLPLYTDVLDDIEQNAEALDIGKAAERVQVPWLLIHGTDDESVGFSEAEVLRASGSTRTATLMPIERAGHTFGAVHPWRSSTPHLEQVFDATLAWLTRHLH
jgi:uncharacterized protein